MSIAEYLIGEHEQIEAAECGEDVAELRCVDESAVSKWKRSIDVVNCVQGEIDLSQLEHFQPTHAVEIARHFRKLRGKAEKWDEDTLKNLCRDHPKALDAINRACKRTPADNKPVDNIHEFNRPDGTSREAGLRRLRKDRPDLHEQVLEGKKSVHAACVEAGFRKKLTALEVARLSSLEIRSACDETTILANGNQSIQLITLRGANVLITKQSSDPRQVHLREAGNKVRNLRRDVVATQACGGIVDQLEGIGDIADLLISHLGTLLTAGSHALYSNCNSPRVKRNWRLYDDYFGGEN